MELTLGEVAKAVEDVEQSVTYANRGDDTVQQIKRHTTIANVLHRAGRRTEAETRFREAEQMQQESQPAYPLLYSLRGFQYCDLLLAAPERAAWQRVLELRASVLDCASPLALSGGGAGSSAPSASAVESGEGPPHSQTLREVRERVAQTLKWVEAARMDILSIALDHLTLGRAALYAAVLERGAAFTPLQRPNEPAAPNDDERGSGVNAALQTARRELDASVAGLRRAGTTHHIPRALLTRAWCSFAEAMEHRLHGRHEQAAECERRTQEDLDEAWEIAERGPVKLFLADIHLYRARLFGMQNAE